MDGKLPRGNIRNKGEFDQTDLTGFLLKVGQGDLTVPGGWRLKILMRY